MFETPAHQEERLARGVGATERRRRGVYYTPAPLAAWATERAAAVLEGVRPGVVVDPACGAGAFLVQARARWPDASLVGFELSAQAAAVCRERVPSARVVEADAFDVAWDEALPAVEGPELWLGNPPYNGTSALLGSAERYARARALLPKGFSLPRGTSLRDDFAFFLLLAAARLRQRPGALAFVTPSSFLDSYLYRTLREALLSGLELCEVADLGGGVFEGARVRTCVTVWRAPRAPEAAPVRFWVRLGGPSPVPELQGSFEPQPPERLLRPAPQDAAALDAEWRAHGEPLSQLVPVSFPGLKTRFDALLVDRDPDRLLERVGAFLGVDEGRLLDFARAYGLPEGAYEKLAALKRSLGGARLEVDPARVRPFFRYAGARHRTGIPDEARAFCYLDRRLIPRGDHRLQGEYDPHACTQKLVFNVRERPLSALLVEVPGCVHAHRHTRFAPLWVPGERRLRPTDRRAAGGAEAANLSPTGLRWAESLGGPLEAFRALAAFINSDPVQRVWAPAFGASRELWVPLQRWPSR